VNGARAGNGITNETLVDVEATCGSALAEPGAFDRNVVQVSGTLLAKRSA
jgi:hypothetical protein